MFVKNVMIDLCQVSNNYLIQRIECKSKKINQRDLKNENFVEKEFICYYEKNRSECKSEEYERKKMIERNHNLKKIKTKI